VNCLTEYALRVMWMEGVVVGELEGQSRCRSGAAEQRDEQERGQTCPRFKLVAVRFRVL